MIQYLKAHGELHFPVQHPDPYFGFPFSYVDKHNIPRKVFEWSAYNFHRVVLFEGSCRNGNQTLVPGNLHEKFHLGFAHRCWDEILADGAQIPADSVSADIKNKFVNFFVNKDMMAS